MTDLEDLDLEFPCNPLSFSANGSLGSIPISESELFDYFLNEDFDSFDPFKGTDLYSELNSNTSSPVQSSPQTSPPQITPESPEAINRVQTHATNIAKDNSKVKQESTNPLSNSSSCTKKIQDTNSKKRDRATANKSNSSSTKSSVTEEAKNGCFLSRGELLKLSSKELESYAKRLAATRPLTNEEEKQLKKQRRLIKNRESAQLSRMRKKVYIEELEKKLNHLTQQNESLTKQVASINLEKKKLTDEVVYLQNIVKQSPQLSAIAENGRKPFISRNVKAAGVCLLIVLFSFGLLFNVNNNHPNRSFPKQNRREEVSETTSSSSILHAPTVVGSFKQENVGISSFEKEEQWSHSSQRKRPIASLTMEPDKLSSTVTIEQASEEWSSEKEHQRKKKIKVPTKEEELPPPTLPQNLDPSASSRLAQPLITNSLPLASQRNPNDNLVALMVPASLLNQQASSMPVDAANLDISLSPFCFL